MKLKGLMVAGLLCGLAAWGIKSAYFGLTDGFSIANISSEHPDDPRLEMAPLSALEAAEIDRALCQKFTYLAKGNHSYVFESQDGQYVIKFLQFQKYRHHPVVNWLPLPASLDEKRWHKTLHKQAKRDILLKSWKIAFTKLRKQTQLVFVHLNRALPLSKVLTVYNKCGLAYHLDLNQYVFMLQKKVDMFAPTLERYVVSDNVIAAKQLLDNLIDLYQVEYRQGIFEEDRYIVRNTGVVGDRPMHLDVDRFREDVAIQEQPHLQVQQLLWKTAYLLKWLEARYPELAVHLKGRLQQL